MGLFKRDIHTDNLSLQRAISNTKRWKIDTVCVSTYRNCPQCKTIIGMTMDMFA